MVEGEGGLTPGRVAEALAAAGTASLDNLVVHVDWNQASIDSNRVCREDGTPGDYVQWTPMELFYLHDWNVIEVPDGRDFQQVIAAQRMAASMATGQPTAIVYRTVKGWRYGIEGRASHGAGHKLCSDGFYHALAELSGRTSCALPSCEGSGHRCEMGQDGPTVMEAVLLRRAPAAAQGDRGRPASRRRPWRRGSTRRASGSTRSGRKAREGAPRVEAVYELAAAGRRPPAELALKPGTVTTLRGELGRALQHYNKASGGALLVGAADLLGSTSVNTVAAGFGEGFWNAAKNPAARTLSIGGICEDAMAGILSGLATFGRHVGVGSSYGAFLAPLGHIAARLHAIGAQARAPHGPWSPFLLVCAHAGPQDRRGRAHPRRPAAAAAPAGELPPRDVDHPHPVGPRRDLDAAGGGLPPPAGGHRPVRDAAERDGARPRRPRARPGRGRGDRRLPPAQAEGQGRRHDRAAGERRRLRLPRAGAAAPREGRDRPARLLRGERGAVRPAAGGGAEAHLPGGARARGASGITGFTLPTLFRWVVSDLGRAHTLHPFKKGHFLGSGQGPVVLAEAGLDGASQAQAIRAYVEARKTAAVAR